MEEQLRTVNKEDHVKTPGYRVHSGYTQKWINSLRAPMDGSRTYTGSLSCGDGEVQGVRRNDKTHSLARKGPLTRVNLLLSGMVYTPPKGLDECVECHPEGAVSLTGSILVAVWVLTLQISTPFAVLPRPSGGVVVLW